MIEKKVKEIREIQQQEQELIGDLIVIRQKLPVEIYRHLIGQIKGLAHLAEKSIAS